MINRRNLLAIGAVSAIMGATDTDLIAAAEQMPYRDKAASNAANDNVATTSPDGFTHLRRPLAVAPRRACGAPFGVDGHAASIPDSSRRAETPGWAPASRRPTIV